VAARDEAGRIGPCVGALRVLADEVVVVDDGSTDATAAEASEAGATVLRTGRRAGKGGALEGALRRLGAADLWLLADGDLGATASRLSALLEAVDARPPGGEERTEVQYAALLDKAGFKLTRVVPTASPVSIVEATPR
jgi:glycosyltransferase involved in cell wall biosynthesis